MIKKYVIMINWTENKIGDSGAIKISESLMKNTTLTTLDLGGVIEKGKNEEIELEMNRMRNR